MYRGNLGSTFENKVLLKQHEVKNKVTEWPPIGKIAAHSAYYMFHGIST